VTAVNLYGNLSDAKLRRYLLVHESGGYTGKLKRLSATTQDALKKLACLGKALVDRSAEALGVQALLAHYAVRDAAVAGLPDEVQAPLRFAPHRVERIVPQQKD
jgi:hypothetical protein